MIRPTYVMSRHASSRVTDRFGILWSEQREMLQTAEFERIADQADGEFLLQTTFMGYIMVFPCRLGWDGRTILKTVLEPDMAKNNMSCTKKYRSHLQHVWKNAKLTDTASGKADKRAIVKISQYEHDRLAEERRVSKLLADAQALRARQELEWAERHAQAQADLWQARQVPVRILGRIALPPLGDKEKSELARRTKAGLPPQQKAAADGPPAPNAD